MWIAIVFASIAMVYTTYQMIAAALKRAANYLATEGKGPPKVHVKVAGGTVPDDGLKLTIEIEGAAGAGSTAHRTTKDKGRGWRPSAAHADSSSEAEARTPFETAAEHAAKIEGIPRNRRVDVGPCGAGERLLTRFTVPELRDALQERGRDTTGLKKDLILRLLAEVGQVPRRTLDEMEYMVVQNRTLSTTIAQVLDREEARNFFRAAGGL